ncbi:hypothetical protein PR048_015274 [Dryococelus australis]|uniref:Uncharacterized protein n=1 Tax=Dryococelus australis TaxID=614101 RepID=A0ABQ9HH01_9NEOP|nr:hypothetical protein PR048_015274 [Dryococelus australis]
MPYSEERHTSVGTQVEVETYVNVITVETEEGHTLSVEIILAAGNHDKDINVDVLKPKRNKRHQVKEDDWECKKAKILREQVFNRNRKKLSWKERKMFIKSMKDVNVTQRSPDRKHGNTSHQNIISDFF